MIQVKDVKVMDNAKITRIHVNFPYPQKQCNTGMDYFVPINSLPIFKRYVSEICSPSVEQGSV